jgi:RNA polymerase sigma factor (sigma-70 family)
MAAVADRRDCFAFARLYDHFAPRLKAYMLRCGCEHGVAEELAQEVMLAVWRHAGWFDPRRASLSTWLFTIARNHRIDAHRRANRGLGPGFVPMPEPQAGSPETDIQGREREIRIRKAIAALPLEEAELIRLAYIHGKSHSRIAAEHGLPLGTVKSRLRRALRRLRHELYDEQ